MVCLLVYESESHPVMSNSLQPHGLYSPWNSLGQNTGVGSLSLLQGTLPNPGLWHCRRILYQLSHKGSPRILEWVAYLFSSRSSQPRNQTQVSCIAGGFFTNWVHDWNKVWLLWGGTPAQWASRLFLHKNSKMERKEIICRGYTSLEYNPEMNLWEINTVEKKTWRNLAIDFSCSFSFSEQFWTGNQVKEC